MFSRQMAANESDFANMALLYDDVASKFDTLRDYLGNLDITGISA